LPTSEERHRSGGAGVYYHYDYVGGPRNYKWIDTNPIPKVWEQMNLAHKYGADRIWIVNVGDFKPKEFPIEFFLRMALDPDAMKKENLFEFTRQWAAREFGPKHAAEIARIIAETGRLNGRKKPELVDAETYSLINYREAERVHGEFQGLLTDAEAIAKDLPAEYQSAFYEIVIHRIKAPMVVNDLYAAAARNALYAKQGRASANLAGANVRSLFDLDSKVTAEYHAVNGGKWNHFMDQTHIGYTSWQQPNRNIMPRVAEIKVPDSPEIGVSIEGSPDAWPGAAGTPRLEFTRFGQVSKRIEVFCRGSQLPTISVSTKGWIRIDPTPKRVAPAVGLNVSDVSVDWSQLPSDHAEGLIEIFGGGTFVNVEVSATRPPGFTPGTSSTFLEGDGVVAIEAEHTSRRVGAKGVKWETIPGYGRTLSGLEAFPAEFKPFEPGKGARLEYDLTTFTAGKATLDLVVGPSLAFQPSHGLRIAVAFDDQKPQVVDAAANYLSRDWEKAVSDAARHVRTDHNLAAGRHMLKVWAIDPGVVIQRVVVDLGGLKPSYLGPPESLRAGQAK